MTKEIEIELTIKTKIKVVDNSCDGDLDTAPHKEVTVTYINYKDISDQIGAHVEEYAAEYLK
jgi:hypothetical protein